MQITKSSVNYPTSSTAISLNPDPNAVPPQSSTSVNGKATVPTTSGSVSEFFKEARGQAAKLTIRVQREWDELRAKYFPSESEAIPDLLSIKKIDDDPSSGYEMKVLSPGGSEQTIQLKTDSALAEAADQTQQAAVDVHKYFTIEDDGLTPRPGVSHADVMRTLAKVDSVNTLTAGFAVLFFQGQSKIKGAQTLAPGVADALKAQFLVQTGQYITGLTGDAQNLWSVIRSGLSDARRTGRPLTDLVPGSVIKGSAGAAFSKFLARGDLLLSGASLGLNAYLYGHATTEQEKASLGTNLAFDTGSLILAGTGVLAQVIPQTTLVGAKLAAAAPFLLPASVLLAGVGTGIGALAEAFGANADKAKHVGAQFDHEISAYEKDGGYQLEKKESDDKSRLTPGPVTITELDLRAGQVEFKPPEVYRSTWRSGLHGVLPGIDPDIRTDDPIDTGQTFNLPSKAGLPSDWKSVGVIQLPSTPAHAYSYDWNLLPGAEWRGDGEFQRLKELEKTGQFQFAFGGKVVTKMTPVNKDTRISVKLMEAPLSSNNIIAAPSLVIPDLGSQGKYINYNIVGMSSEGIDGNVKKSHYSVSLHNNAKVRLSTDGTQTSEWYLSSHNMDDDAIGWSIDRSGDILKIGSSTIIPEKNSDGKFKKGLLHVYTKSGIEYKISMPTKSVQVVSMDVRGYTSTEVLDRLNGLAQEKRLSPRVRLIGASVSDERAGELQKMPRDVHQINGGRYDIFYQRAKNQFSAEWSGSALSSVDARIAPTPSDIAIEDSPALREAKRLKEEVGSLREDFIHKEHQYVPGTMTEIVFYAKFREEYQKILEAEFRANFRYAQATHQFDPGGKLGPEAERLLEQFLPSDERKLTQNGPRRVDVSRLEANGYPAIDALVISRYPGAWSQVLYLPHGDPQFQWFDSNNPMSTWLAEVTKTTEGRGMLSLHFREKDLPDGNIWSGVSSTLRRLGDGSGYWMNWGDYKITNINVFAGIANLVTGNSEDWKKSSEFRPGSGLYQYGTGGHF